jgi:hypothetical protein
MTAFNFTGLRNDAGFRRSAIGYQRSAIGYQRSAIGYQRSATAKTMLHLISSLS